MESSRTDSAPDKPPVDSNSDDSPSAAKDDGKKSFASKLKGIWTGLEMDVPTLLTMMKGGLPPSISLAMYHHPSPTTERSTLQY